MFVTDGIREKNGRFCRVSDRAMFYAGIERRGVCSACGHKIRHHYGVEDERGRRMWVGSRCVRTLCDPDEPTIDDVPPGGTWKEPSGREYIVPTSEWRGRLFLAAHGVTADEWDAQRSSRGMPVLNWFLHDIFMKLQRYGQLTVRQHEAASRVMEEK